MKPIVIIPKAVLTTKARTITTFDESLRTLLTDMHETLLATTNPKGVGLAAPQIGVDLRVFITKPTAKAEIRDFINPEIIQKSDEKTSGVPERENKLEGCLSIPNIWGTVHRASTLTLRYQDPDGKTHEEAFSGFLATIIQHETDHVNGILFTQRVLEQKERLYQIAHDDEGKEFLDEIKV